MVNFNFKAEFIPKILSGEKCSTIRQTKRCKVGDTMHLYTDLRTKKAKKIGEAICFGTAKIKIDKGIIWQLSEQEGSTNPKGQRLSTQEGFQNEVELMNFFKNQYGLPFIGYLHAWKNLT